MSNKACKRIIKDLKLLDKLDIKYDVISKYNIECYVEGPKDTIYENGKWKINIVFPENYPFKSPSIGFIDKIYHPNVDYNSGSICLNVLNEEWQPIYTIQHIIETFIPQLLTYPNSDDPLNLDAAKLYICNRNQFDREVKMLIFKQNKSFV